MAKMKKTDSYQMLGGCGQLALTADRNVRSIHPSSVTISYLAMSHLDFTQEK